MNAPARGGRVEVVYLVAAAACWGIGTVISKQAVAELPPLTLLVMQLASSVAFLAVLGRAGEPKASPRTAERRILARLGLLNPGLAYALSLAGLTQITASLAVLLWATEPILILALASLVLGERLGLRVIAPTAIAVGGLALVVFDPAASGSPLGVALTVAGVVACAIYSVGVRRWLPGAADSTLDVVLGQQRYALGLAVVALAGLALAGHAVVPAPPSLYGVASAVASGLLYYAFAYLCYLSAVRTMPVSVAAASFYLIPIFGVGGAWLAGERLQPIQWLGAILVVVSVAVITTLRQPSSAAASAQIAMTPRAASRR
jgi:drug/metabolite transporter (DMT)-like permease